MVSIFDIILGLVDAQGYFTTYTGSIREFAENADYNKVPLFAIDETKTGINGSIDAQGFPDRTFQITFFVGYRGEKVGFSDTFSTRSAIYQPVNQNLDNLIVQISRVEQFRNRSLTFNYKPVLNYTASNLTGFMVTISFKVEPDDDLCLI